MNFKIGDKVVDIIRGEGIVIDVDKDEVYGIDAQMSRGTFAYTIDGKYSESDIRASLYHKGTTVVINPAKPTRDYPWANIYTSADCTTALIGVPYPTKEAAVRVLQHLNPKEQYVDTIQLKPKDGFWCYNSEKIKGAKNEHSNSKNRMDVLS